MYAGGTIKMKAQEKMFLESGKTMVVSSLDKLLMSGTKYLGIRSDGTLGIKSKVGGWEATSALNFKGKVINLNGAPTPPVPEVPPLPNYKLADTKFNATDGWIVDPGTLETIVTRAPTHEPYPYHAKGVNNKTDLNATPEAQDPVPSTSVTTATTTATTNAPTQTALQTKAANKVVETSKASLSKAITAENYVSELPASTNIGQEAQEIYNIGQRLANPSSTPTVNPTLQEQIAAVEEAQGRFNKN
jgi:hypothetical protein